MKHLASWIERSSERESLKFITELALAHAQRGGQTGVRIAELIAQHDYVGLCSFELDYNSLSMSEARNCRQALAFFKKCNYLPLKVDRQGRAKAKFDSAELKCRDTNELFDLRDRGLINFMPWADAALSRARAKISRILGPLPSISELDFKFGPGATTLTKKSRASVAEKLTAGFSCSEDLLPYASRILEEMPTWFALHESVSYEVKREIVDPAEGIGTEVIQYGRAPVVVTPGRVNFVPKDALTDRTVIVSGSLNVILSGAIGRFMFNRLKASGIDLSDQEINQDFARIGSLTGEYSTLDLVSASDMMAIAIVRYLLPWEWYFFLSTIRSSEVTLNGGSMILEKFSSMGDGFTFPLQSLIFYALASSVVQGGDSCNGVSVYGDDIIAPSEATGPVMELLHICGFEVNKAKSYWTGPFRESCGADYLRGINIRPWYHRDVITPMDLFRLHNFYVRHQEPEMAELIRSNINDSLVMYGPDGYGDGHLLGDWSPKRHKRSESHGYGGVLFDTFKLKPLRDKRFGRKGDRVLPGYTIYVRENVDDAIAAATKNDEPCGRFSYPIRVEEAAMWLGILRKYNSKLAVEALPEGRDRCSGVVVKHPAMPGTKGYVRVSIYTFNAS
jgi:hypothetical protein